MKGVKRIRMLSVVITIIALSLLLAPGDLKTKDMNLYVSDHFAVYFEPQDEQAAIDVIKRLESELSRIHTALRKSPGDHTEIYIYRDIKQFNTYKYGRVISLFIQDGSLADHKQNKIMMVSPSAADITQSYDDMLKTAVHEYVRIVEKNTHFKKTESGSEGLYSKLTEKTKETAI